MKHFISCCLLLALAQIAAAADSILVVSIDALHPAALGAATAPTLHALMQPGRSPCRVAASRRRKP